MIWFTADTHIAAAEGVTIGQVQVSIFADGLVASFRNLYETEKHFVEWLHMDIVEISV